MLRQIVLNLGTSWIGEPVEWETSWIGDCYWMGGPSWQTGMSYLISLNHMLFKNRAHVGSFVNMQDRQDCSKSGSIVDQDQHTRAPVGDNSNKIIKVDHGFVLVIVYWLECTWKCSFLHPAHRNCVITVMRDHSLVSMQMKMKPHNDGDLYIMVKCMYVWDEKVTNFFLTKLCWEEWKKMLFEKIFQKFRIPG